MVLPLSGTISLTDIQTEFGGSTPISISEYYRNGGLVISIPENANIPITGSINLSNFFGATFTAGFSFSLLATGTNTGAAIVVTPSKLDPRRNIVVIHARTAGGTGLLPAPAATIAGTTGTIITALNSTAYDDGQAVTVSSGVVKTGSTVSITLGSADGTYAVYEMYGISNVASAVTAVASVRNTSGSDSPLSTNIVSVATSAADSIVLFIGQRNFNGATSGDSTGKLDSFTNGASALVGFDTNPTNTSTSYTFSATSPALIIAIAINKNAG